MEPSENVVIKNPEFQSSVTYHNAKRNDTATYTLVVSNEYGKDTCEINVIILSK